MENVIMMINNAGDVFELCISTKGKQTQALQLVEIKANALAIDMRVIFHINDTTIHRSCPCKFMKNLTTCGPNYMQIYFQYNTVTSACQGSGLACSWTVSIFRTLSYMQTRLPHQKTHLI